MKAMYEIIVAQSASQLENAVQGFVNKGYIPQGGVCISDHPTQNAYDRFYQAVYRRKTVTKKKATSRYPEGFETMWALYPKRNGSNPKNKALEAWIARVNEGCVLDDILNGLHRYSRWCDATHKTGTEKVMQASRFFGPGLEFLNSWELPVETAEFLPLKDADLLAFAKERGLPGPDRGEFWDAYRARLTEIMRRDK